MPGATAALPVADPAPRNPMDAYLASLSPNGRRAMRERLRAVARLIGVEAPPGIAPEEALRDHWHRLPFERVERIRQELLARGAAPSTVNLTLAALKGIARYARKFGLITLEDERHIREVAGAKGERPPAGRALAGGELAALARACADDAGPAGARDLALLAVWRVAGVRRAELAALTLGDYRPGTPPLLVVQRGKGNKGREIPLNADAGAAVGRWLRLRGRRDGALFCRIDKWGNLDPAAARGSRRTPSTRSCSSAPRRPASTTPRRTTSGAPPSATSSTPGTTWPPPSSSPATPARSPPPATTAAAGAPGPAPPPTSASPSPPGATRPKRRRGGPGDPHRNRVRHTLPVLEPCRRAGRQQVPSGDLADGRAPRTRARGNRVRAKLQAPCPALLSGRTAVASPPGLTSGRAPGRHTDRSPANPASRATPIGAGGARDHAPGTSLVPVGRQRGNAARCCCTVGHTMERTASRWPRRTPPTAHDGGGASPGGRGQPCVRRPHHDGAVLPGVACREGCSGPRFPPSPDFRACCGFVARRWPSMTTCPHHASVPCQGIKPVPGVPWPAPARKVLAPLSVRQAAVRDMAQGDMSGPAPLSRRSSLAGLAERSGEHAAHRRGMLDSPCQQRTV